MSKHHNSTGADVHKPFRQEFPNTAARTSDATVYTVDDLNKVAIQLDDNTLWRLSSIGPTTWVQVGGGGGADPNAIHDNVAGEVAALSIITLDDSDSILVEDASNANAKARVTGANFVHRQSGSAGVAGEAGDNLAWTTKDGGSNGAGDGGIGGALNITAGTGGTGSNSGGAGGGLQHLAGAGGAGSGVSGGAGGDSVTYAGAGGATDPAGNDGGAGGDVDHVAGNGGTGGTGTGGAGGRIYLSPGSGGDSDSGQGGNGGLTQIYSGSGGSGPSGDGDAGPIQIIGGNGGALNGGGGGGGRITIRAGDNTDPALNPLTNQLNSGNLFLLSGSGADNDVGTAGTAGFYAIQGGTGGDGTSGNNGGAGGMGIVGGGQGGTSDSATGGAGGLAAVSGGVGGASGGTGGTGGDVALEGGNGGSGANAGRVLIGTNQPLLAAFGSRTRAIEMGNTTHYPPITQVGSVRMPKAVLTPGANIDVNLAQVTNGEVTLDQNSTLDFSNVADGVRGSIVVKQDGTGGWTLANGTNMKTPGGTPLAISAGANSVSVIDYYCDGVDVFATLRGAAFA